MHLPANPFPPNDYENIHPRRFSVHRVYTPLLVATEPGAICMLWHFISMMISGFAEDLSPSGPRGLQPKVICVMLTSTE